MKIIEKIFDSVLLLQPDGREDSRGTMQVFFSKKTMTDQPDGFNITEQRIYKMPKKHTFFGIHYQKPEAARGKLISLIQGKALDYIVDLRPDSKTISSIKALNSMRIRRFLFLFLPVLVTDF